MKSGQVRKVADSGDFRVIFPYVSFYTPGNSPIPICLLHFNLWAFRQCAIIILVSLKNADNDAWD